MKVPQQHHRLEGGICSSPQIWKDVLFGPEAATGSASSSPVSLIQSLPLTDDNITSVKSSYAATVLCSSPPCSILLTTFEMTR